MADGGSNVGSLVRWGLIGGALSGIVNVALHAVAVYGLGDPMAGDGGMGFMAIPIPLTFVASVLPGAVAALVHAAAQRLVARPTTRFLQLSVAVLLVSLVGPATMQGATTLTVIFLEAMHVVAAAGIMWGVVRGARS